MTATQTDAIMALADRYAFHIPGSRHSDEARAVLLAALQEQAREGEAVAWHHGCNVLCANIDLWIDRCPHCGKPRPAAPAPRPEQPSEPAQPEQGERVDLYSLDSDTEGIRARVVHAVLGALAFGARNENKPPADHWLSELWEAARAERDRKKFYRQDAMDLRDELNSLSELQSAQPVAQPLTDDPLQGAVDWLLQANGEYFCVATVQRTLCIGYNRAKRLADVAKERAIEAAHGIGGAL